MAGNKVISVPGYTWYGHNRLDINPNAIRGSGGVGFLIANTLLQEYTVQLLDKSFHGIFWIRLNNKTDDKNGVLLCACYLPPEGSSRGNTAQEFYDTLLTQTYMYYDGIPMFYLGDFNGRMGNKDDFNPTIDNVMERHVIDSTANKYGDFLIDFLCDIRCCTLNGRGDINCDNFTSVTPQRGRSVVDYIITPYDQLSSVSDFKVTPVSECIDEFAIHRGSRVKVPDHSLLSCHVRLTLYEQCSPPAHVRRVDSTDRTPSVTHHRYRLKMIPDSMFRSERCQGCLEGVISNLELNIREQNDIDTTYQELLDIIHDEMNSQLQYKDYTPGTKSRRKYSKPYWNDELQLLWTETRDAEKKYLKWRGDNTQRNYLRRRFLEHRKHFDKELRRTERRYNAQQRDHIQQLRTDDPKGFWDAIRKLGPGSATHVNTDKVKLDNGSISMDPKLGMAKWKTDIEALYQRCNSPVNSVDDDFLEHLERQRAEWEEQFQAATTGQGPPRSDLEEDIYLVSLQLNASITLQETINALKQCKNGKATSIDNIPNEILKVRALQQTLHKLFRTCFETGKIPSMWYKGIIHPILKTGKDPLLPLSHRGISLMSTVAKIFSAIINNRLTTFMESHGIYAEKQNGFRRLRSCLDHLYTLTNIIRNRKAHNQETFCAFIDFEKAFDSIHYPLLWFKLAACGIQGKILQMIQSMYSNLECCIRVNGRLTDWFSQTAGVRQGDTLAPTLFAIFINDLVPEINNLRCGLPISDDNTISILLYADDIVLISDSSDGLQNMLNTLHSWSKTWMLKVNNDKSKIMHFRKSWQGRTQLEFPYGDTTLDIVHLYRYLGLNLYEHMDFSESIKCLTTASSRALGAVTNKHYSTNGLDYTTYTKLYDAMVSPVMD